MKEIKALIDREAEEKCGICSATGHQSESCWVVSVITREARKDPKAFRKLGILKRHYAAAKQIQRARKVAMAAAASIRAKRKNL